MSKPKRIPAGVINRAFAPVDIASLVFFRIAFGAVMMWEVWRTFAYDRIYLYWIKPRLLFKYFGFSWVEPWPDQWLYIHWGFMGVLALFIAIGFLYRGSMALFFLSYTYFFLLDAALYVNHTYLVCLFSFLMILAPANRALAVDATIWPKIRSQTYPAWILWLLRLQMGVVYFFAGVAKISGDWLRGEPARFWANTRETFASLGGVVQHEWFPYFMSYGGFLFDLLVVFFLIWKRTRIVAFCVAVLFHLMNAMLFSIGFFPWLAIGATTLFLSPGWPRRALALFRYRADAPALEKITIPKGAGKVAVLAFVIIYSGIQLVLPLRRFASSGGMEWTYAEHRFSWQMMLVRKSVASLYYVIDPNIHKTVSVKPRKYLLPHQERRMGWRPDMVVQFARYLATVMPRAGLQPLKVETRTYVSLNGRKPKLFIDPNTDLAAQPWPFGRPHWLLRVDVEPLPPRGEESSSNPYELRGSDSES